MGVSDMIYSLGALLFLVHDRRTDKAARHRSIEQNETEGERKKKK